MKKGKAFILVGHENWGKSRTIYALTESNHVGWFTIHGTNFFIRRMSNDDKPDELLEFIRKTFPVRKPYIIITLCPNFEKRWKNTTKIIGLLKEKYDLYFLIIKKKFIDDNEITQQEIDNLSLQGIVEIIEERINDRSRAERLKAFILEYK
jgi:hypothetical protein